MRRAFFISAVHCVITIVVGRLSIAKAKHNRQTTAAQFNFGFRPIRVFFAPKHE